MNKQELAEAVIEMDKLEQLQAYHEKLRTVVHSIPDRLYHHSPPSVNVEVTLHLMTSENDVTFNLESTLVLQLINGKLDALRKSLMDKGVKP